MLIMDINLLVFLLQVVPNPITKGEHCGACGDYDGNKYNNIMDRQGQPVPVQFLPQKWCK